MRACRFDKEMLQSKHVYGNYTLSDKGHDSRSVAMKVLVRGLASNPEMGSHFRLLVDAPLLAMISGRGVGHRCDLSSTDNKEI